MLGRHEIIEINWNKSASRASITLYKKLHIKTIWAIKEIKKKTYETLFFLILLVIFLY
jgi:hypothetical protein